MAAARLGAVVGLACVLAVVGCGGDEGLSGRDEVRLPRGANPRFLSFAADGSIWISETGGGALARLESDGHVRQYRLPDRESSPNEVEEGPEGAIWTNCLFGICRVDPEGPIDTVSEFPPGTALGLQAMFVVDPDGSAWIAIDSTPLRIARTSPTELLAVKKVPTRGFGVHITGMALGPDGALWFTYAGEEGGESADAVGRLGRDGKLRRWRLPDPRSGPAQIVAGPDGALWFVEQRTYRIARITTDGAISEFQLRPGLVPADIAAADRALWFTTEKKVGQITFAGKVRTWPLDGAEQLEGIAVADGGAIWVADPPADTIRRFHPPS